MNGIYSTKYRSIKNLHRHKTQHIGTLSGFGEGRRAPNILVT